MRFELEISAMHAEEPISEERLTQIQSWREDLTTQLTNIQNKLDSGKKAIKKGHKVKGINPTGEEVVVDLTSGQIGRLYSEGDNIYQALRKSEVGPPCSNSTPNKTG